MVAQGPLRGERKEVRLVGCGKKRHLKKIKTHKRKKHRRKYRHLKK